MDSPDSKVTDAEFRARREKILLRQLVRLFRLMNDETVARMQARGFERMQPSYPRLLGNLDTEGTRISGLARRMGITRQAVAQLVKEIEAAGFVERRADPEDGRGVIVAFTPKGRQGLATAVEVMAEIEAEYAGVLGQSGLDELKGHLKTILDRFDRQGGFGMD
ncbi:MarR family winged helix-turn-helix transcriptional regulator [Mesorhizobium sp. GbtcB19]|uniref:MarR family winged helix-turn-helix transcriptional regulator n=1 Tax=Mesorhizobium sp. GbtcB19 TaxID=2824764 RepID=UPI001C2FD4FF|nr:MarR family transcriptional regulator [Mesorhizobium sp. GbtcB19]